MVNKPKISTTGAIVLSVLVVCVMVIVLVVVGRSFITRISHNSKVIGKKQTAEKTLTDNLKAIPQLTEEYKGLKNMPKAIDNALPVVPDFPGLVATMEVLAGSSDVLLSSVTPQIQTAAATTTPAATTSDPTVFPYSVSVAGNYTQLLQFMTNLELSARPIKIDSMQLSGTTDSMSGAFSLTTYYYDPKPLADKTEEVK